MTTTFRRNQSQRFRAKVVRFAVGGLLTVAMSQAIIIYVISKDSEDAAVKTQLQKVAFKSRIVMTIMRRFGKEVF